jgi:hypothetical protein
MPVADPATINGLLPNDLTFSGDHPPQRSEEG